MKKRITAILLLSAMLVSFAACGGDPDDTPKSGDDTSDTTAVTESLPAGIEKKNYESTFNILYPDWGLYKYYFFAEENSGEVMDVALFNRELKVEEYLGVEITNTKVAKIEDILPAVQEAVMSGDDLYQLVLAHCITGTAAMITSGYMLDLNTIPTLDLENEWWNHTSNNNLAVADKQFWAIGDYNIPDPNAVLFNKELLEKYDLENPYDIVRSGEWTIDKMMEMMSAVTTDNGDSVWDVKDTYGFGTPNDWFLTSFTYASGLQIVDKDEDGEYIFAMNNERVYDMTDKLHQLLINPDTYIYDYFNDYPDQAGYDASKSLNISTGRCLFNLVALNNLNAYRDTTVDFGILPYPKLDAEQEDYISLDWSGLMGVPASAKEHDMIGEVVELLAYYSEEEVLPAYHNEVLGLKLSRDDDSREMLQIIFDGIVFDAGMNYFGFTNGIRQFWDLPDQICSNGWSGYASYLASYQTSAESALSSFNNEVAALD